MTLHEIRVSEIQPGDEWLLEAAWVHVTTVEVKHPGDQVVIRYYQDGDEDDQSWAFFYRGFEVAVVKRPVAHPILAASRDDIAIMAARELIEAYDAPFPAFGDWANRLEEKIDALRDLLREPEPARPREWHDHDCGGSYGDKPHWHYT